MFFLALEAGSELLLRIAPRPAPRAPAAAVRGTWSAPSADLHPWLRERIAALAAEHHTSEDETLRGKALAGAWAALAPGEEKAAIRASIVAAWAARGWWEAPPSKAARQTKAIYGEWSLRRRGSGRPWSAAHA